MEGGVARWAGQFGQPGLSRPVSRLFTGQWLSRNWTGPTKEFVLLLLLLMGEKNANAKKTDHTEVY
jgi:hypothetical protein